MCQSVTSTNAHSHLIVLGEADRDGLTMFESIARWNLHMVPGFTDEQFSVIHGDDLAQAMILAAAHARRANGSSASDGIYLRCCGLHDC